MSPSSTRRSADVRGPLRLVALPAPRRPIPASCPGRGGSCDRPLSRARRSALRGSGSISPSCRRCLPLSREVLAGLGVDAASLPAIRTVCESFARVSPINLVVAACLARLLGEGQSGAEPAAVTLEPADLPGTPAGHARHGPGRGDVARDAGRARHLRDRARGRGVRAGALPHSCPLAGFPRRALHFVSRRCSATPRCSRPASGSPSGSPPSPRPSSRRSNRRRSPHRSRPARPRPSSPRSGPIAGRARRWSASEPSSSRRSRQTERARMKERYVDDPRPRPTVPRSDAARSARRRNGRAPRARAPLTTG